MHGVVDKPALRAIAYLACILDTSGLLTSAAYRLRLRFLKARNLDEQFAQVRRSFLSRVAGRLNALRCCSNSVAAGLAVSWLPPLPLCLLLGMGRISRVIIMKLIYDTSAILLFLTSLSGSLFSTVDAGKAFEAALGTPELALLTVGLSFAIIHGRFVFGSLTV